MRRRVVLMAPLAFGMSRAAAETGSTRRVALGEMHFAWWHEGDRLFGTLSAPGRGWLAVGFNDERRLAGTRFVIAAIDDEGVQAEVHVAMPPDHPRVEDLGGQSDLRDLAGVLSAGRSELTFSLPVNAADAFGLDLQAGRSVHLMLAWSHEADFAHHSAWRRHIDVLL